MFIWTVQDAIAVVLLVFFTVVLGGCYLYEKYRVWKWKNTDQKEIK